MEFIGSLFYLALVYLMAIDGMKASTVFTGVGAFWLPVFVGVAVISAIALLFFSFSYITDSKLLMGMHTKNLGLVLAVASGITFLTLTVGSAYFLIALIGFLLSLVGGMAGYKPQP